MLLILTPYIQLRLRKNWTLLALTCPNTEYGRQHYKTTCPVSWISTFQHIFASQDSKGWFVLSRSLLTNQWYIVSSWIFCKFKFKLRLSYVFNVHSQILYLTLCDVKCKNVKIWKVSRENVEGITCKNSPCGNMTSREHFYINWLFK